MSADSLDSLEIHALRPLRTAIVGGGHGCVRILKMVHEDQLGRFQMNVLGVADLDIDAPGIQLARETGVELLTTDYRDLFDIQDLDLIIELVGSYEVRDAIERERPRQVRFIDHFGARLFWDLHQAEEVIIDQRTAMREEVERERAAIAQIYDAIPDEILVLDADMQIEHANASFLRNNNVALDDIVGSHCYEVDQGVRGDCQVAVGNCPHYQVMNDGVQQSIVRKHFDDEGNTHYASIVAAPLYGLDGKPSGIIEMTRDITHRIELEEELKATEVQLKHFLERAPLATFIKNRHGQYIDVNPATCKLYDKSRSEIVGKTDLEILPRAAADTLRLGDKQVLRKREDFREDVELVLGERRVFLRTVKYPVTDADGQVSAVAGMSRDITVRKRVEAELESTREYLQSILDNSPVSVITTDLDARVASYNRGSEIILGYTADEIIGQPVSRLYRDPADRMPIIEKMRSDGAVNDKEVMFRRKDGSDVPVSLTLAELKDNDGNAIGTVGMARDNSHRQALMNQVMQSERLAAVGRLAAGVAHEINNPLAVISEVSGYLRDLIDMGRQDTEEFNEELHAGLPKIAAQIKRCRNITTRLLNFARKSEARVEVADVAAALDEILPFLEKEARLALVTIHRDYPPDIPRVLIEEMQLEEIFINLVTNAIQALGEVGGGNIWLETEIHRDRVVVKIRDDGPGIAEDVRNRLFDPFVSTKPTGHGTGLGLSICYGIIKRYDGEIRVESNPDEGAEFQVILRVHRPPSEAKTAELQAAE